MFGIIKQANGNVLFLGEGINKSFTPDKDVRLFFNTILLENQGRAAYAFAFNQVAYYSLDGGTTKTPAPATVEELTAILQTSFFFEAGAGGSVDITGSVSIDPTAEASAAIIATPTATVTFADITKVSFLRIIPTLNCILQGINSTGITKQQTWWLLNDSTFSVTLPEENINPAPPDRFIMSGTSQTLQAGSARQLVYDLSVSRFRIMS